MDIEIEEDALNFLADICDGDARIALNALELAVLTSPVGSDEYDMLIKGYTATNPLLVAKDVKVETVAQIEERSHEFPGVIIDVIPQRKYVDASSVAHVLGHIGVISEEEYKTYKDNGYTMNDMIGKGGIEKTQESQLRGINGKRGFEVDTNGRLTAELSSEPAIPVMTLFLQLI